MCPTDWQTDADSVFLRSRITLAVLARLLYPQEAGFSISGKHVAVVLDRLASEGAKPKVILVDNGPEFVSKALDDV